VAREGGGGVEFLRIFGGVGLNFIGLSSDRQRATHGIFVL
jgi:hypothetical protein